MKNNHYEEDDDEYVYAEEQERPRAQTATIQPVQPVQPVQTRQPSKNERSKHSQFPTGTVYPEGFLSKPRIPNKRSERQERDKTTTKKLKLTPRLIPPAPQRLQVGSSYRNDLVRALDEVTESSESEDDSEDSNDEYFDTNSMNEWYSLMHSVTCSLIHLLSGGRSTPNRATFVTARRMRVSYCFAMAVTISTTCIAWFLK